MDIGPTVLDMFGVQIPAVMDGRPLAVAEAPGFSKNGKSHPRRGVKKADAITSG
jgi:arylsulfatase A-like enzyme